MSRLETMTVSYQYKTYNGNLLSIRNLREEVGYKRVRCEARALDWGYRSNSTAGRTRGYPDLRKGQYFRPFCSKDRNYEA